MPESVRGSISSEKWLESLRPLTASSLRTTFVRRKRPETNWQAAAKGAGHNSSAVRRQILDETVVSRILQPQSFLERSLAYKNVDVYDPKCQTIHTRIVQTGS